MAAPEKSPDVLDRWMDDISHGGDGALPPARRPSLRQRLAQVPWSWLVFPVIGWLAWRGVLRLVLAWGYASAPLLALGLITWEAWRLGRRARRRRLAGKA